VLPGWLTSAHTQLVRRRVAVDTLSGDTAMALVSEFVTAVRTRDLAHLESLLAPRFRATVLGRTRSGVRPITLNRRHYVAYIRLSLFSHDLATYDIVIDRMLSATPSQVKLATSVVFSGNTDFVKTFPDPPSVEATVGMFQSRPVFARVKYVATAPNNRWRGP
jgi:hypothetical protein